MKRKHLRVSGIPKGGDWGGRGHSIEKRKTFFRGSGFSNSRNQAWLIVGHVGQGKRVYLVKTALRVCSEV